MVILEGAGTLTALLRACSLTSSFNRRSSHSLPEGSVAGFPLEEEEEERTHGCCVIAALISWLKATIDSLSSDIHWPKG